MNTDFIRDMERPRILRKAAHYLATPPETITATACPRSAGGPHDYYSEGDYWWPDPGHPGGPFVQRDGQSNPNAFTGHRQALMQFGETTATLGSAFLLTRERRYADALALRLRAWFLDPATRMNPHMEYAQAIPGVCTGRGIGIIDTLPLVEASLAAHRAADGLHREVRDGVRTWFGEYLHWMRTHPYGIAERDHPNNHGISWTLQSAAFAQCVGDAAQLDWARRRFRENYLPEHMNAEGGFPAELRRTKPYGYSLFVLELMAGIAQICSTPQENLWRCELADGRGMRRAMAFLYPHILDKTTWPYPRDIMYWEVWPARQMSLLLGGIAFEEPKYTALWQRLEADPTVTEIVRNLPLRHPLLWIEP